MLVSAVQLLFKKLNSHETQTFLLKQAEPTQGCTLWWKEKLINRCFVISSAACLRKKAAGGDFERRMNYGFD